MALSLPGSDNWFFIYVVSYIHMSSLFPHFVFLFSPSLFTFLPMRQVLQFMFESISLEAARNITEIKNTL